MLIWARCALIKSRHFNTVRYCIPITVNRAIPTVLRHTSIQIKLNPTRHAIRKTTHNAYRLKEMLSIDKATPQTAVINIAQIVTKCDFSIKGISVSPIIKRQFIPIPIQFNIARRSRSRHNRLKERYFLLAAISMIQRNCIRIWSHTERARYNTGVDYTPRVCPISLGRFHNHRVIT